MSKKTLRFWLIVLVTYSVVVTMSFCAIAFSLATLTLSQNEGERVCMEQLSACQFYNVSLEEACYFEEGQ